MMSSSLNVGPVTEMGTPPSELPNQGDIDSPPPLSVELSLSVKLYIIRI